MSQGRSRVSYSVGGWFKANLRNRLPFQKPYILFLRPSGQVCGQHVKLGTTFLLHVTFWPSAFNHPAFKAVNSATDNGVNSTINGQTAVFPLNITLFCDITPVETGVILPKFRTVMLSASLE